ncbi:MAG: RNA-binding S4 domain-containing protein [Hydrogenovibrio sp.]|uniref:RNA-binding S4 domain-containing protein n=1 Tax=Hydrogenovibrio TaxID=28884 RepID=UPI000371EAC3|nr:MULTISPECIES: RNA-binding S4 domain-containing protein [Hydrogenovibrio]MDR9499672.1 RNA-binding S4 domain-containing protein [Hydrogenovibrio sp.]
MSDLRIDKWLWAARFFKTRSLAQAAVKGGKVVLNGQRKPKPSKTVAVGDELVITQAHRKVTVTVEALSAQRGNADMARTLYTLKDEQLNQKAPPPGMALAGHREKGKGRPTKRERRELEKFQEF